MLSNQPNNTTKNIKLLLNYVVLVRLKLKNFFLIKNTVIILAMKQLNNNKIAREIYNFLIF